MTKCAINAGRLLNQRGTSVTPTASDTWTGVDGHNCIGLECSGSYYLVGGNFRDLYERSDSQKEFLKKLGQTEVL